MKRQYIFRRKEKGSVLFIMIMILVALTVIVFLATNIGKTDMRISTAYTEQNKAFIAAESMLSRLRFALEQLPLPEGISNGTTSDKYPIWMTSNLASAEGMTAKDKEPDFSDPSFAHDKSSQYEGWAVDKTLTCSEIENWMKNYTMLNAASIGGKFQPLDCSTFDPNNKTRTIIELVNQRKNESDIDEMRNTYYFRITVRATGDSSGEAIVQGITGIQYN